MNNIFPIWLVSIDYILGILMLIFIIKFLLNIALPEDNKYFFHRIFNKITQPIIIYSSRLIPYFIIKPIHPLYIGWLIFMLRIYFLPLLLGYSTVGSFAFVFEKDVISSLNEIILNLALYLNYGL